MNISKILSFIKLTLKIIKIVGTNLYQTRSATRGYIIRGILNQLRKKQIDKEEAKRLIKKAFYETCGLKVTDEGDETDDCSIQKCLKIDQITKVP